MSCCVQTCIFSVHALRRSNFSSTTQNVSNNQSLQCKFRGHLCYLIMMSMKQRRKEKQAAKVLQRLYRGYRGRIFYMWMKTSRAAVIIQCAMRCLNARRLLHSRRVWGSYAWECASKIQVFWRGYRSWMTTWGIGGIAHKHRSAIEIQRHARALLARRLLHVTISAAIRLQHRLRSCMFLFVLLYSSLSMLNFIRIIRISTGLRKRNVAALKIQSLQRGRKGRAIAYKRRHAFVSRIQRMYRAFASRKALRQWKTSIVHSFRRQGLVFETVSLPALVFARLCAK